MTSQTPVQIAWVTRDLDATESALTTLLGAGLRRRTRAGAGDGVSRRAGFHGRRHDVRLPLRRRRGGPYREIAYIPPEIKAFFDYVKKEQQQ